MSLDYCKGFKLDIGHIALCLHEVHIYSAFGVAPERINHGLIRRASALSYFIQRLADNRSVGSH